MLNNKKLICILVLVLFASVALFGCGGDKPAGGEEPAAGGENKETTFLNIATGPSVGVYYPLGSAMAQAWSKYIPDLQVTATASNAGAHNINLMDKGDAQVAYVINGVTSYAVEGINEFEGRPHDNLRGIAYIFSSVDQFVARKGSGLNSMADLKGKKFVPGGMASGADVTAKEILSYYDLDYKERKDIAVEYVNFTAAVERMKNNQCDAALILTGVPNAAVMELISSAGAYLLPLDEDKVEEICKDMPYYTPYVIKANSYPNQEEDVLTVCQQNWILVDESMDEEMVYQMTKVLYDKHDELVQAHAICKNITLDNTKSAIETMPIPLHPGAERYYKEVGIIQ